MRAHVVGAGIIGLSAAVRLLERGHEVRVLARERTPRTTSDVAAAVHFPFKAAPPERVLPWARATREELARLATVPGTGVAIVPLVEVVAERQERPWWADMVPSFRRARPDELPPGERHGWVLDAPVVEMPRYLRWLEARVAALGGAFEERALASLDEALAGADVVVHCAGLGARELARDPRVFAIRGQVARLQDPGVARATLDESTARGLAYVIPRSDGVIVGGTADERAEALDVDAAAEAAILARAASIDPRLRGAPVLARAVGLRPARDVVRLEREGRIVHNYGHGGSGVTLSWGCADEAARLAEEAAREGSTRP